VLLPVLLPVLIIAGVKPKVTLLARVSDGTESFAFITATIGRRGIVLPIEGRGRFFEPDSITGFYARYPANGKRKIALRSAAESGQS
jgi:hypothetical protein